MRNRLHIILTTLLLLCSLGMAADNIRYVSKSGKYDNDGKSWSTAKLNIQDAINDLVDNNLTGEVWVAEGTYTPTESTESSGGSTLYMSFKIPAGIKVYGGFKGDETDKDKRVMDTSKPIGKFYRYRTVLSGDLSQSATFEWNATKNQWNTSFYGNCYHVVTFATNGFDSTGRAHANGGGYRSALLEGCIIQHGNAYNSEVNGRPHNAYGGGVYMVAGAHLKNCFVRECVASRNGGGIYMDGGGYIEHVAVSNCQAVGIGTSYGYGGGICMDGPADYSSDPQVQTMINRQGGVVGCVGRMGGGMAIIANDMTGTNKYKIACTALLVANNTALTEAGGIYMNKGGAITQMTVVRNKCVGTGTTSNGMVTGRAAGIYCRDNAVVANTIMWGGECSANNNIQYACSRSGSSNDLRPYVMYTSLTQSDYTDWSGVIKNTVMKLSQYNTKDDATTAGATVGSSEGFPMFYSPTPNAGYVDKNLEYEMFYNTFIGYGIHLYKKGSDGKGTEVAESDLSASETYYTDAACTTQAISGRDYLVMSNSYDWQPTSRSSVNHAGINVVDIDRTGMTPAFQVDYDLLGNQYNPRPTLGCYTTTSTKIQPLESTVDGKTVYNFYVDPNENSGEEYDHIGDSWDEPIRFLADALTYISNQNYGDDVTCNIFVKQGTVNNTNSTIQGQRIRVTGFAIPSNTNIYGGYPTKNTGTSTADRNPNTYMTTITGNVQGEYDVNVAHLIRFRGTKNSTLDGFSIRYANARSTEFYKDTEVSQNGAALVFGSAENISIKNCGIAGNTANSGAAARINTSKGISFENCIFHNNESRELNSDGKTVKAINGNILVESGSEATFNHCDFLRNVGFAIDNYGTVKVSNSVFYGNMSEPVSDTRNNGDKAVAAVRAYTGSSFTSDHNFYDTKSADFVTGLGSSNSTNDYTKLDYTFSETSNTYPRFNNPTKNAGVTTSGDATYYGRTISFMPHNNNPMVNAAALVDADGKATTDHSQWGRDMTGVTTRDYGGLPDVGAIENHEGTTDEEGDKAYPTGQLPYEGGLYVRDYGSSDNSIEGRDGSSWENALNGNATYTEYSSTTTYTSETPQTSTLDTPRLYKIGMLATRTTSTIYYAKYYSGTNLRNSTVPDEGDDFILMAVEGQTDRYYIYDYTKSMYVVYNAQEGEGNVYLSETNTTNATWHLGEYSSGLYLIQPGSLTSFSNNSLCWNYHGGVSGHNLGFYYGTDNNSCWQFFYGTKTTSTTGTSVSGLQYAIDQANAYYTDNHKFSDYTPHEVRVGAGTYKLSSNLEWKVGANVKGGYPGTGNPGDNERDISNSKSDYMTILDGQGTTRVLYQSAEFADSTAFEGFTIQNGASSGTMYGAGAYLQKNGYLLNCLVKNNTFTLNSSSAFNSGGGGIYMASGSYVKNCKIQKNYANNTESSSYPCGAGVFSAGGILENSLIVENEAYSTQKNILGAALFINSKSELYNCTIAYNFGNVTDESSKSPATGGVWDTSGTSEFYNCIMWGNYASGSTWENMVQVGMTGYSTGGGVNKNFHTCYSSAVDSTYASDDYNDTDKVSICNGGFENVTDWSKKNQSYAEKNYKSFYNSCKSNEPFVRASDGTTDYSLKSSALACINKGSYEDKLDELGITVDITGADRVQDCTVDKGAYEYNGSLDITPDTTSVKGQAIFYVTPNGKGNANANSPTNAACAAKLQKVLDAAGRYKYSNSGKKVIVKVAGYDNGTEFLYYATRTTDATDDDVRIYSIIVPRGVEVWGGYTDAYTDDNNNGFHTIADGKFTDKRDITGHPTYFNSVYYNTSHKTNATTYHVVTFTDKVFDADGNPYLSTDQVGGTSSYETGKVQVTYMSMKDKGITDRAVLDGIYIIGGEADAKDAGGSETAVNINQYGGAAIVTDYAHVRNCIVQGNSATYGGALALTHGALVSGCLIDKNTADYGGALYVFEEGTQLSDGTIIETAASEGGKMDENMAHVYTSTIVNNTANQQGGGIWFGQDDASTNVRVNSSVVWQNSSQNQPNVSGLFNPEKTSDNTTSTVEFYPFSYCAVQNLRLSGTNNLQLAATNANGARFAKKGSTDDKTLAEENTSVSDETRYDDFGYYGLTSYSVMVRTGMPTSDYTTLINNKGLATADFMGIDRLISTTQNRSYIEMGARALDKAISNKRLMLRLFVAQADDINMNAAQTMMNLSGASGSDEEYYSQEGSSFAYPMQNLQDALDYIIAKRSINSTKTGLNEEGANNLPFEICMGRGTYYPTRNHAGEYGQSPGNSFAIPEGVSIYGGFNIGKPGNDKSYFGGYYKKGDEPSKYSSDISKNVTADKRTVKLQNDTYIVEQLPIDSMTIRRPSADVNGNGIIEPWEFQNQTILSGEVVSGNTSGVYHVVSCVADQNVVGVLPLPAVSHKEANDTYHTNAYDNYITQYGHGSFDYEEGQAVTLDGLQVTGGKAMNFVEGSTSFDSKYNFYNGGGLMVDGNRYCDAFNKYPDYYKYTTATAYKEANDIVTLTEDQFAALEKETYHHQGVSGAVGYRDIPVNIVNCKFYGNEAGFGGAVYSNGGVDIHTSAIEQNKAVSGSCSVTDADGNPFTVNYAGDGGAVFCTHQFTATNTMFANNEAYCKDLSITPQVWKNLVNNNSKDDNLIPIFGGCGGAVYMSQFGFFHIVNCDIVRNQANMYPSVYTLNPNMDLTNGRNGGVGVASVDAGGTVWWRERPTSVYYNQLINTVIWGNDVNSEMSSKWDDANRYFKFNARLICNYATGAYNHLRASSGANVGIYNEDYTSLEFKADNHVPRDQSELDANSTAENSDWGETAWFCAYEEGRGISPLNDKDLRAANYTPLQYARDLVYAGSKTYQNCNVLISSENFDLEGPNFVNPSTSCGYNGYNESADWSPARLSNLTDNGSGQISQTITNTGDKYTADFKTYEAAPSRSVYYNSGNTSGYTNEIAGDPETSGAYTTTRVLYGYEKYKTTMPVGETQYMLSFNTGQKLYRISYDPNPTHDATYIDIGVYEYPHTELSYTTDGDEVDILWVSPKEKPDNGLPDGSDWSQPTSDLQRAIETLLASRNGHRKEIRLMDGTFTPIYSIEDHLSFYIDTKTLNSSVTLTKNGDDYNYGLGVKSLTIKGGYSQDLNNVYDPQQYPAILRQQSRTNATSDRWDHLFYIDDATQRYGAEKYDDDNNNGAWKSTTDKTVNTIPIHIDGVTMVNNQALAKTDGAALYYADRTETDEIKPSAANVSVNTYYTDAEKTTKSDTPTQYYDRTVDGAASTDKTTKYKYVETAVNKLILSKSKIMNSGSYVTNDYSTSAVYIGKNGGDALLYNNVMHSNQGNPLVSKVKTTTVNNTYALNYGLVDLSSDDAAGSTIFNSVLWRNNASSTSVTTTTYGDQFSLKGFSSVTESGSIFANNAYTGGNTETTDYGTDGAVAKNNNNVGLKDENDDVMNGPNFTDPKVNATSSTAIEARDFTLHPSLRLINKGNNGKYNDNVKDEGNDHKADNDFNIVDLAWNTTTRTDAAGEARFVLTIDLGAYEYQNNVNRIIYVDPNNSANGLGNSWSSPVAIGYLQAAIDLAAVYHVMNPKKEAYVFVKGAGQGNSGLHLGEDITMRDGVSIYGSLLPTRTEDCTHKVSSTTGEYEYTDNVINSYISDLTAERAGIASTAANKTTVSGIKAEQNISFDKTDGITSLVDGFDVTATTESNTEGRTSEPVIDVQPKTGNVALRNIIVHDNNMQRVANTQLAVINNALIYEALFRDNKMTSTSSVLKLESSAYAVNVTVEGKTVGEESHIYNSLVNYSGQDATEKTLSGYNYKVSNKDLNYQLTENSKNIDACEATNPLSSIDAAKNLATFINYDTDRDLLGNLRLLKNVSSEDKIDRGAFETWKVENDVECKSTQSGSTTKYVLDTDNTYKEVMTTDVSVPYYFYPQPGSVVYLMQGKSLVLEKNASSEANSSTTPFTPAYLLVQDGASLYGNGNAVNVAYVGVERKVMANGSMVSLPYAMQYKGATAATNGVGAPSYDSNGVLTLSRNSSIAAYSYNGAGRSAWDSKFYTANSAYWTALDNVTTAANQGTLVVGAGAVTARFTAQGDADDMTQYVYTEAEGETCKVITLTQHDDRTSTNGGADFTEKEDMGWNCIGLPYLVSNYNTADKVGVDLRDAQSSSDDIYNLHIPHTLWLYYDGKVSPDNNTVDGDGGFYSVSSWDTTDWHIADTEKAAIWVGEGFFTQTSAVSDTEDLTFYRPVYATTSEGGARTSNARYYVKTADISNEVKAGDITIRANHRTIYVSGLEGGETITIYDTSGRIQSQGIASSEQYSTAVSADGIYIVKVNSLTRKLAIKQ